MIKHTEGPWHIFSVYAQHEVRTPTDGLIAVVDSRQNARLISAAPDLLEALQSMVDCVSGVDQVSAINDARAAIAAAKQAQSEPSDDPLQGAVDWFLQADGECFCVATVQRTLRIGYNRAQRLCDIAKERAAHGIKQGGQHD